MKSNKTNQPVIQVHGRFSEAGANDEELQRTYRYHVHIENADKNRSTDYDRILTIKTAPIQHIPVDIPDLPINDEHVEFLPEPDTNLIENNFEQPQATINITEQNDAKVRRIFDSIVSPTHLKQITDRLTQIVQSCSPLVKKQITRLRHKESVRTTWKIIILLLGTLLIIYFVYIFYKPDTAAPYKPVETNTNMQDTITLTEKHQTIAIPLHTPRRESLEQFPITEVTESYTVVQQNEVIHTVVLGDTLWFIAKRYINNPLRYPELARLSNIKNPDLIYPGDQIRIFIAK